VTDASYFVAARGGRGAQAHRLLRHLCRREPAPDSVSLVGDRRSGKTSLLGFLKKAAQKQPGLIPLSIDMQTLPEQTSDGFYTMLTRSLIRAGELPPNHGPLSYLDFEELLQGLTASGRWMVLFIDEFDTVARDRRFALEFFDNLRSCASVMPLTLVIASVAPLSAVAHAALYGSPFFNIFNLERLVPLSLVEAQGLIHRSFESGQRLAAISEEIISLGGCHPFFLQSACACAYDIRDATGAVDVTELRSAYAARMRDHFKYVWDHLSTIDKASLHSLALGQSITSQAQELLVERGYAKPGNPPQVSSSALKEFIIEVSESRGSTLAPSHRRHTFISYSHKDEPWLHDLKKMLAPLLRSGSIDVTIWDDTKIKNGDRWDDQIQNALTQAGIALLLVSDNFLASEYIMAHELPFIVTAAKKKELLLLWVLLSDCLYAETDLKDYQAVHDTSKPLSSYRGAKRKAAIVALCKAVKTAAEQFLTEE
jgi:hypothetical protein